MVHTAIGGVDRSAVIKILVENFRPDLEQALGVTGKPADRETPQLESAASDYSNELTTIEELLKDEYNTDAQKAAFEAAKKALTSQGDLAAQLAAVQEQLRALTEKDNTSQTRTLEQEEGELGNKFIQELNTFAENRLQALGLSAAEGDPPELVKYIEAEKKKILDLLPDRFEKHEKASKLIPLVTAKFKKIPKMEVELKKLETEAAWKFMPGMKVCVDDILKQEVADCLFAIETARQGGAKQGDETAGQRKEIVGHEAPTTLPPANNLVKGKGTEALWADLTGRDSDDRLHA
jgi:hypothetical protein